MTVSDVTWPADMVEIYSISQASVICTSQPWGSTIVLGRTGWYLVTIIWRANRYILDTVEQWKSIVHNLVILIWRLTRGAWKYYFSNCRAKFRRFDLEIHCSGNSRNCGIWTSAINTGIQKSGRNLCKLNSSSWFRRTYYKLHIS